LVVGVNTGCSYEQIYQTDDEGLPTSHRFGARDEVTTAMAERCLLHPDSLCSAVAAKAATNHWSSAPTMTSGGDTAVMSPSDGVIDQQDGPGT
jgi:hypothetical protein